MAPILGTQRQSRLRLRPQRSVASMRQSEWMTTGKATRNGGMRLQAWPVGWLFGWLLGGLTMAQAAVPEQARFGIVDGSDGLPSTEISGIAQDREGFLWLATGDGLARYDGADFKVWRHDPRDPGSLPGNSVQALYIDAEDRIWVAAENHGVSVLDGARQQFAHYDGTHYPQLRDEDVIAITGRGREVWFGTQAGQVYRVSPESGLSRLDTAALLPADAHIMAMVGAPDGVLWIGTTAGLLRQEGHRLQREPMPAENGVLSLAWIDNRLWVGGTDGVIQRDLAGHWHRPGWSRAVRYAGRQHRLVHGGSQRRRILAGQRTRAVARPPRCRGSPHLRRASAAGWTPQRDGAVARERWRPVGAAAWSWPGLPARGLKRTAVVALPAALERRHLLPAGAGQQRWPGGK